MVHQKPVAFMSYARFDDTHDDGFLGALCKRLSDEIHVQTGKDFPIFFDRKDIKWGQNWKERIENSIDEITFLIPMITPNYFESEYCMEELRLFLERVSKLGRKDLILPIYYITCPLIDDAGKQENNHMAQIIASRNYYDWRQLRFKDIKSSNISTELTNLAIQIKDLIEPKIEPEHFEQDKMKETSCTVPISANNGSENGITASDDDGMSNSDYLSTQLSTHLRETSPMIVGSSKQGSFTTIGKAIHAAKGGDTIIVHPGKYREQIVIDKPLNIVGEGNRDSIIIETNGKTAVVSQASHGLISNLTILTGNVGNSYGIDISQGRLIIEDCDISSQSLACIAIHGGSDPILRRNIIHHGKESGILIFEDSRGTCEDNEIYSNQYAGIEISKGSNPTLRHNMIYNGKYSGILMHNYSNGIIEDNDIFSNADAGIDIRSGCNPIVRLNRIYNGKMAGIYISSEGQGIIEKNDIHDNDYAGIAVVDKSHPSIKFNQIYNNIMAGIFISQGSSSTIEQNYVYRNGHAGIAITQCSPLIQNNKIHDGNTGVYISSKSSSRILSNKICANLLYGVEICNEASPTLINNRINKNAHVGIRVHDGASGLIEDNDLSNNVKGAWEIVNNSTGIKKVNNIE